MKLSKQNHIKFQIPTPQPQIQLDSLQAHRNSSIFMNLLKSIKDGALLRIIRISEFLRKYNTYCRQLESTFLLTQAFLIWR